MHWYLNVLKNYAKFNGRSTRQEYWMFYLFNFLITFVLVFFGRLINSDFLAVVFILYFLATLVPTFAVLVRRMHDIGKSGWNILLFSIPIAGIILYLVYTSRESQQGDNKYGPNPKISNSLQSQSAATIETIFCGDCGRKTPVGKFCVKCGKELRI